MQEQPHMIQTDITIMCHNKLDDIVHRYEAVKKTKKTLVWEKDAFMKEKKKKQQPCN